MVTAGSRSRTGWGRQIVLYVALWAHDSSVIGLGDRPRNGAGTRTAGCPAYWALSVLERQCNDQHLLHSQIVSWMVR